MTEMVKLSFKNRFIGNLVAKLQVSNTYKVINLFIRKKLYFIYFTSFKITIKLKFQIG